MNLKKLVAKTLVFAMAMTFVPAVNMGTAKAAAPTNIVFAGSEGTITSTDAKFWGVAKEVKDEKKANLTVGAKHYLVSNVEEVVDKTIDVSALGSSKENVIAVGTKAEVTAADWTVKVIPAEAKNFLVGYYAKKPTDVKKVAVASPVGGDYGYLAAVTLAVKGGSPATEFGLAANKDKIQVKQGNGSWKKVSEYFGATDNDAVTAKLHMLSQRGSTLTFRIMGDENTWPSKEVKVKIPAQAKGPSIKVDVAKDEVSLKAGMKYRVTQGADVGDWKAVPAATKKMKLTELDAKNGKLDITKDATIEAITDATEKKGMSKASLLSLKTQAKPTTVTTDVVKSGDIITGKLTLNVKASYDIKKGAELVNVDTTQDYEVCLEKVTGANPVPTGKAKWIKVKAAKAANKPVKVALKYSSTEKPNTYTDDNSDMKLFVRSAGSVDRKTGVTTMGSAPAVVALKLANVEQVATMTAPASSEIQVVAKTAKNETAKILITNIVKFGGTPKLKVTSPIAGVALKAGKVTQNGSTTTGIVEVTVKVTDKAFPEAISGTKDLKFTITYEGVTKEFTLKFKN